MPFGRQWFPIPWIDGSSEEESKRGMIAAVDDLNAFLDAMMVDEDVLPEQVVLFGFSQGTMMALHVAPRREDEMAGIVAFSGRLLEPELLADETVSRPPVLLVHGDQDDVVPPQSLPLAAEALQQAGFKDVFAHIMKGTAHGIAPDGAERGAGFHARQAGALVNTVMTHPQPHVDICHKDVTESSYPSLNATLLWGLPSKARDI